MLTRSLALALALVAIGSANPVPVVGADRDDNPSRAAMQRHMQRHMDGIRHGYGPVAGMGTMHAGGQPGVDSHHGDGVSAALLVGLAAIVAAIGVACVALAPRRRDAPS